MIEMATVIIIFILWLLTTLGAYVYFRRLKQENNDLVSQQLDSTNTILHNTTRFHTLLNNLPDMVLTFDSSFRLIFANDIGRRLVNSADLRLLDKSDDGFTLSRSLTRVWFTELLHVLNNQEARTFEFSIDVMNTVKTYEVHAVPDRQNLENDVTIICVIRDITTRKTLEEQRMKISLEQQRVLDMSNVSNNIAHDIKNPLSAIGASAYVLRRISTTEKQQTQIDNIEQNIKQISTQLDNLLLLTQLDANTSITLKSVDLEAFLRQLANQFEQLAQQNNKVFTANISALPTIRIEYNYLRIAIEQVLYNAINYTSHGDTIHLSTMLLADKIQIDIKDSGIGMDDAQMAQVFDRFYRGDSARPRNIYTGGSGIGLSIAKAIIERYDGKIRVESKVDEGTTFSIQIPHDSVMTQSKHDEISAKMPERGTEML